MLGYSSIGRSFRSYFRGNPFLRAVARQKFLPPNIPLGTKFSSEPRTRLRLAHSRLKISLSVSRPYAHVVRPGRFGKSGLSCFYPIAKLAGRQVYMGRPAAGRGSGGGKILPISQKRCRFFVDSGARVWYNQRRP